MFNLFNSITFYIILGLSISTLGFGYLSYRFHGDREIAIYALKDSKETIAEYEKSLNLKHLSCEISDKVTNEYQTEKQVQQDKVQSTISKIDALPQKPTQATPNEINDINIDSKLPDSIISLLRESCLPDEGLACVPSR